MGRSGKIRHEISPEQERAIELLIAGKTDKETAEEIGVSRQTVNDWQRLDPSFMAEFNRRRKAIWESQAERLRNLVSKAITVVEKALDEGDVKVATAILRQFPGSFWDTVYNPDYLTTAKGIRKSSSFRDIMKEMRELESGV